MEEGISVWELAKREAESLKTNLPMQHVTNTQLGSFWEVPRQEEQRKIADDHAQSSARKTQPAL